MKLSNSDLPAMPNSNPETYPTPCAINYGVGLTKREMFAMHAMQGILSNLGCTEEKARVAIYAVDFADNLLSQLENDGLQKSRRVNHEQ